MLGRIFVVLCRLAPLRKILWRSWYEYLAAKYRAPDWTFMNYGYADVSSPQPLKLAPTDEPDRYCIQLYNHVAGAVDLAQSDVLEVGSGRGGGASFIKRYLHPANIVGVDLSQRAVDFSRATHRVEGLEFQKSDAERLPFGSESFDAVVNVESSHCYPSLEAFLSEVHRVLRPSGYFLYADFRYRSAIDQWRHCLENSGLTMLRENDITPNVLAALDADDERKLALIRELIPRPLRRFFLDFAGVRGSAVYEAFRTGKLVYVSYVTQKRASPKEKIGSTRSSR